MADTLATRRANNDILLLIGRILAASIFLIAGIGKLMNVQEPAGAIESVGLPYPLVLAWATAICETVGGLLLLIGFMTRPVAVLLALFCLFSGYLFHFDPAVTEQMQNFMKNVALAGGYLAFAAVGAGRYSLDRG